MILLLLFLVSSTLRPSDAQKPWSAHATETYIFCVDFLGNIMGQNLKNVFFVKKKKKRREKKIDYM